MTGGQQRQEPGFTKGSLVVDFGQGRHGAVMHEGKPIAFLIDGQAIGKKSTRRLLEAWQEIGQPDVILGETNVAAILSRAKTLTFE